MSNFPWSRIVSYYARPASFSTGGVNTSRQQWMASFSAQDVPVLVLSARNGFDSELVSGERLSFRSIPHVGKGRMTMIPVTLFGALEKDDLVYLHEGWTLSNLVASWICRIRRIDYVVIPHGVYSPGITVLLRALPVRRIIEATVLKHALAVHLFFDSEKPELALLSPAATPVVSVTGLDVPNDRWDPAGANKYIAWVGRYDVHHKGIDNLFTALQSIPAESRPFLRMHGPDHLGDKARVAELIVELGLSSWVELGGELTPAETREFMRLSQGFIHVPRWEAFGRTIVEALSIGCPVVLGSEAHIATVLGRDGAALIVVGSEPTSIAEGLLELWNGRVTTSQAGRDWVQRELSWASRATDTLEQLASLRRATPSDSHSVS